MNAEIQLIKDIYYMNNIIDVTVIDVFCIVIHYNINKSPSSSLSLRGFEYKMSAPG